MHLQLGQLSNPKDTLTQGISIFLSRDSGYANSFGLWRRQLEINTGVK
jgi:hypothetical protein